jgi:hypothetical protein
MKFNLDDKEDLRKEMERYRMYYYKAFNIRPYKILEFTPITQSRINENYNTSQNAPQELPGFKSRH